MNATIVSVLKSFKDRDGNIRLRVDGHADFVKGETLILTRPDPVPPEPPTPEPPAPTPMAPLHVGVEDKRTGQRIPGARCDISEVPGTEDGITNENGYWGVVLRILTNPAEAFRLEIHAEGYHPYGADIFFHGEMDHIAKLEPLQPPAPIGNREPKGILRLDKRTFVDDNGPHLGLGFSFFCAPRLFRDYRDRYDRNMAWGAEHGFTYYRPFVLTGGWPDPDPWRDAGAFLPWALEILPQMLDDAFTRYRLRASLTLFDGFNQTPSFSEQKTFVRDVCAILQPRLHTIQDVQIANEYGPTGWDFPEGIGWLREHARLVRGLLPNVALSISTSNAAMNDADHDTAIREYQALFDLNIVNLSVPHDSRETRTVEGPWRHVRKAWERVLHDHNGQPLEPDASVDDEPMGFESSVATEHNISRLVGKAMVDFVSGRCAKTEHHDAGIWSNLMHPAHKAQPKNAHKSNYATIPDHPEAAALGRAYAAIMPHLPKDLPNWSRTRHGLANHPFGSSFVQQANGLFTQIWPDGHTHHGVVRAYCAFRGNDFVCVLTGIRDRIDLKWTHNLTAKVYACGTGQQVAELSGGNGTFTVPEAMDTDCVVIGRYV